jgi:hypothetical protein
MNGSIKKVAFAAFPVAWILAAGLAVAPAGASAFDPTRDDYSHDEPGSYVTLMAMKPTDVMHAMDKGKNGYVTREEFMKFMDSLYTRMDANHGGKVTEAEWVKNIWTSP